MHSICFNCYIPLTCLLFLKHFDSKLALKKNICIIRTRVVVSGAAHCIPRVVVSGAAHCIPRVLHRDKKLL